MGIKINVMDTFSTVDCHYYQVEKLYLMSLRCAETNLFDSATFHVERCLMGVASKLSQGIKYKPQQLFVFRSSDYRLIAREQFVILLILSQLFNVGGEFVSYKLSSNCRNR